MRVLMTTIQTPLMRPRVSVPALVTVTAVTPTVAPRVLDAITL
jgi:hypothetical protein